MSENVQELADTVIAQTYSRFPIVVERGNNCELWDLSGKRYVDFVAGIAVCNLGHAHPAVAAALAEQANKLLHVSNLYYTEPQTRLARWLVEHSFAQRVFFCNSGAEANEAAFKLARKYFSVRGDQNRFRVISMQRSFHGRTMAALSATGQPKIREGFDPLLPGFEFVPFNDLEALKQAMTPEVCAVIMEPIQGEGGVNCPAPGYLQQVRDLCDRTGALLIFDEIQTGMGRTGKLFAYEHEQVAPDIMTLAKALGNGLPIGAMLAREKVAQAFGPGSHASTFGGTPIITAAAEAVVQTLFKEDLVNQCRQTGHYFQDRLAELGRRHPEKVVGVRGMGLLLGLELKVAGAPFVKECLHKGFLINCVQEQTLRFVPPLTISRPQIDALVECLDELLDAC